MDGNREREQGSESSASGSIRDLGEAAASTADRVTETYERGKAAMTDFQDMIAERTRECWESTDNYVRDNPWQAVGIAAGLGLLAGILISRR